jgi:hypothetical protein
VVEKEGDLHDLCLVVLHTCLLKSLVEARVVLGYISYLWFGFPRSRWAGWLRKTWQSQC